MNFNEEMGMVFKEAGLNDGKLISISKEDKGTPSDYANLERKILMKTEENRNMMRLSDLYSRENLPCGSNTKEKNIQPQEIDLSNVNSKEQKSSEKRELSSFLKKQVEFANKLLKDQDNPQNINSQDELKQRLYASREEVRIQMMMIQEVDNKATKQLVRRIKKGL